METNYMDIPELKNYIDLCMSSIRPLVDKILYNSRLKSLYFVYDYDNLCDNATQMDMLTGVFNYAKPVDYVADVYLADIHTSIDAETIYTRS